MLCQQVRQLPQYRFQISAAFPGQKHPPVNRLKQSLIICCLSNAVSLAHTPRTTVHSFLHRPAGCHLHTLRHRDILHLPAGQKGGQCRRKPKHSQTLQNGPTGGKPAQHTLHMILFFTVPESEPGDQCRCQHKHHSQSSPAEYIGPSDISVGRRCQAACQIVIYIRKGRKHHRQHHCQHCKDNDQHGHRIQHRIL